MIVLALTDCPHALRGDLTRWLFEIDTNIYVGRQSARVREKIWDRVTANAKSGRAIMVYPAKNEQGFDYRIWGATWKPIDFDGLKLMMRPHFGGGYTQANKIKPGYSKAAKFLSAKRFTAITPKHSYTYPNTYLVVDVETTGLAPTTDEIIEIAAIKVINGVKSNSFQALIRIKGIVPSHIEKLTGITSEDLVKHGRELGEVMREFLVFSGELPIMSHNVNFDMGFLRIACEKHNLSMPANACIDTLHMARKLLDNPPDYKLGTLARYFGILQDGSHRGIGDCEATKMLYDKLCNISR